MNYMVDNYGLGRRGTASTGSAASVTDDAKFGGHGGAEGIQVGCYFRNTSNYQDARLATLPVLTTGEFTLDPGTTSSNDANDTFIILFKPFCFLEGEGVHSIIAAINKAIREFPWERRLLPLTSLNDGDMLSTATSSWTATNSSITKSSSTTPFEDFAPVLVVTDSGSGGGYARQGLNVVENKSYYLEATGAMSTETTSAVLTLFDQTNSATVISKTITTNRPFIVYDTVVIPDDCRVAQVRLTTTTASAITLWGNVILRPNDAKEFRLGDRDQRVLDIGRSYIALGDEFRTRSYYEIPHHLDKLDVGVWRMRFDQAYPGQSIWYEEFVTPAVFDGTDDTDTTRLPLEAIAGIAAEYLLFPLRRARQWSGWYDKAARAAGKFKSEYMQQRVVVNEAPRAASMRMS